MSPVAQFDAAAISDFEALSTSRGEEGTAEAGERVARAERARKRERDKSPIDSGPLAQN